MSKSKCEKELEQMESERDSWRNRYTQQKEDIAELERKVERAGFYGGRSGVGYLILTRKLMRYSENEIRQKPN